MIHHEVLGLSWILIGVQELPNFPVQVAKIIYGLVNSLTSNLVYLLNLPHFNCTFTIRDSHEDGMRDFRIVIKCINTMIVAVS